MNPDPAIAIATAGASARTVASVFDAVCARDPGAIAVVDGAVVLTYAQLDRRAHALAQRMRGEGVSPGDVVAVATPRSAASVVALLAVLKCGAAYLPLDPGQPPERRAFMLRDAGASVVLVGEGGDSGWPATVQPIAAVPCGPGEPATGDREIAAAPAIDGDSLAYVMYTSGSTGQPKGVEIRHRSIIHLVCDVDYIELGPDTRMLHAAPLGFDASTLELWGPLLNGGRVVVHDEATPTGAGLARCIATHGVTTAWLTAALFNAVVDEDPAYLAGLRELFTGGEALSVPHVRRMLAGAPRTRLHNGYGPTECTTFTCTWPIPHDFPASAARVPIGRPIGTTRVLVLDSSGEPVADGVTGELHVGGQGVARGYLGQPGLTAERFVPDRFSGGGGRLYRTGDLVRLRADGALEFMGRMDDQLKIRGYRIEPAEIEAVLSALPSIRASCVAPLADKAGRQRLVAYCVAEGDRYREPDLRAALAAKLPEYMLPARYVRVDALPVTANGKLDRRALPTPDRSRPELACAYQPPMGELEARVCDAMAELLDLDRVGRHDNFFELGGDSLSGLRLLEAIGPDANGQAIPATSLFSSPTAAALARAIEAGAVSGANNETAASEVTRTPFAHRPAATLGRDCAEPVAIIGMAGRFPGAADVEAFWQNLLDGRDSITRFGLEGLDPAVPETDRADPLYVPARGVIDGVEQFDAGFFGIGPREAELMDPQQRVFLELCWECLERAGHVPDATLSPVGVFAGMYNATYFQRHVAAHPDRVGKVGAFQVMLNNEKDYIASRVAHKLNLTGPAVSVHTACSTSLVAICQAIDSLRGGQCDMALAGGVAITCPPRSGYAYQEGAMLSPDGHTRTFDAQAQGTVFSDGAAVVVLKRLADAIADGDHVHAVIRGRAVNNDGGDKASFTAPSMRGQAAVVSMALADAGVDARSIGYVEAHGTATPLGDPIEVQGLTSAFRASTDEVGFCRIGSLKSNVGHMVTAAGAAGVIKTALALEGQCIPASIHFSRPNPTIDFAGSPFVVNAARSDWPAGPVPRRAGVSSFGVGGTNAHVVLEEAPATLPSEPASGPQLLVLSARTPAALVSAARLLADHLRTQPADNLADVAWTLAVGRKAFAHRATVVADDHGAAVSALRAAGTARAIARSEPAREPGCVFVFPGQGATYPGMGRALYETEPVFRIAFDACLAVLDDRPGDLSGLDLRERMFSDDPQALRPTGVMQPATFVIEYALAKWWTSLGLAPVAMVGHSVGEFVAATLAGVFSLTDGLRLVAQRGRLMQAQPAGAMLSVRLSLGQLLPRLPGGLSLAAENAPAACVVSGPVDAIAAFQAELEGEAIACRLLETSHAFHSAMMDPVVEAFRAAMDGVELAPPMIPLVSTATGQWLDAKAAGSTAYWARHLREPVRFAAALECLLADQSDRVLLEVGPRAGLSRLSRQHPAVKTQGIACIASLGDTPAAETASVRVAAGELWVKGAALDPARLDRRQRRQRVRLPTYPFQRTRHWVDAAVSAPVASKGLERLAPEPLCSTLRDAAESHCATETAAAPAASSAQAPQVDAHARDLAGRLNQVVEEVAGFDLADSDASMNFIELGLDSLMLTQVALQLQKTFAVKITFRQLMSDCASPERLLAWLEANLPVASPLAASRPAEAPLVPATTLAVPAPAPVGAIVVDQQSGALITPEPPAHVRYDVKKAFGAIARIDTGAGFVPDADQQRHLERFIQRYVARTRNSKEYARRHRPHMADPRVVNGFRPLLKEIIYPIVMERSRGSHLQDLDGNDYVDALNGFGMSLFGWQPDFVLDAVRGQLDLGYEIGPQHPLAGEVAQLACEVTGHDRAALCNTGSEAVLGALRIARTVTGRETVVLFTGAYHGIIDEMIVRAHRTLGAVPAAPGILRNTAEHVMVLEYGTAQTLEILRTHAHTIAAVLVEPVQSRRPDFQPFGFLRELRALTSEAGALLVFDEVVTGFRVHPAGVQGLLGIHADLATYGKVVGGGYPIGMICGKREYMDALDGGQWDYGDDSVPLVGVTYFAGTFVRHPLALAAAKAVLTHVREHGHGLQEALNARTARMVGELNAFCRQVGAQVAVRHFASVWKTVFLEDHPLQDLLFATMRSRSIHILDNFPCFLTTAHNDADCQRIVEAFKAGITELQEAGFLPRPADAGKVRVAPTTEPQREIWLASQLGTDASLAFNESMTLRLQGALERDALQLALSELMARHDALRANVSADGETLRMPGHVDLALDWYDLAGMDGAERAATVAERQRLAVETPFDLCSDCLFRAELLRVADAEHLLLLTAHHIVCDGWSWWVLVRELGSLYAGYSGAPAQPLPPPESFADYAIALAGDPDPATVAADEAYWLSRFADGAPVLELPLDRPRPSRRSYAAAREDHVLDAPLVEAIRALGARRGASLFATLLTAFAGLLSRLSGQSQVVVGIPAAGQSVDGHDNLVGHCVNALPLLFAFDMAQPASAAIDDTQCLLLDALEHQRYTFGTLLRKLRIDRDQSRPPLISVMFNIDQALGLEGDTLPGLSLDFSTNARTFENFELFVNAVQVRGELRLECQFNRDLFNASTIHHWMGYLRTLLQAMVGDGEQALGRLPLLDQAQRQQVLQRWNDTRTDWAGDLLVHRLFEQQVDRTPDAVAVSFGSRQLDYRTLNAQANQLAHHLRDLGIGPDQRVALCLERGPELVIGLLAVLKAGGAYVPLDPGYPPARLKFMLKDSQCRAVLTQASLRPVLAAAGTSLPLLNLTAAVRAWDGDSATNVSQRDSGLEPGNLAYVIYTSGSTGTPKGVMLEHAAVSNYLHWAMRAYAPAHGAVVSSSIAFDATVTSLITPLLCGGTVRLLAEGQEVDGLVDAVQDPRGCGLVKITPAHLEILGRRLQASGARSHVGVFVVGGEALPVSTVQLWREIQPGVRIVNEYGPTETVVGCCVHETSGELENGSSVPIGRPIANARMYILDGCGQPVPPGVTGELHIGGAGGARGYLNRPQLTAERFVDDPFDDRPGARMYRTGDLARWLPDGSIDFLGRNDGQVKIRGYRIEPAEIEVALGRHPSVAQSTVVAREDRPGDVRLVAYVVAAPGSRIEPAALAAHLATTLPGYMVPQHFVVVEAIPLTSNGKVDRQALPAPANDTASLPDNEPRSELESGVVAAMAQVLGLPDLGIHDDFFAVGGHSLLAAQLTTRLTAELGVRVSLRSVFDAPTAARLAALIATLQNEGQKPQRPIQPRADQTFAPLSVMQQRLWVMEQMEPGRVVYNAPSAHRLHGDFDEPAFQRAFAEMVRRQAALRTVIVADGDTVVQHVLDHVDAALPVEDLTALADDAQFAELMHRMEAMTAAPFEFQGGLLFRARLFRLGPQDHVLYFMTHHIIWDGWSFDLMYAEMAALYEAFSQGRASPLPELSVSYGDFSQWHLDWLDGAELAAQLAYWKQHLDGELEPLELPLDHPRPAEASGLGGTEWNHVAPALTDAVRHVGARADATLFMTLLAAYYVLLHRLTGQRDLVVGLPVRNRSSQSLEPVMGLFVNVLPLRLRIDPEHSFIAVVRQVRQAVLDAFAYPEVPFEHLVRELDVARDPSRSPIYQALFSFQDARQRPTRWGGLRHEHVLLFQKAAANDIGMWFLEHGEGLSGGLTYNADILEAGSAVLINRRYQALLHSVCRDASAPVGDIGILDSGELRQLADCNATATEGPAFGTLHAWLDAQAAATPSRTAIRFAGLDTTYAALNDRSSALAARLVVRGVVHGSLVGICLERSVDLVASMIAVLKAGAAYVPLDPAYPADRLRFMAEDAGLALVISQQSLVDALGWPRENQLLVDTQDEALHGVPAPVNGSTGTVNGESLAYVIYTSGSTGRPKGVKVSHRAVLNFLLSMQERPGLGPQDRLLAVTTTSFDIAVLEIFLPLVSGARVLLASRETATDGFALRRQLEEENATLMQATPSTWRMLLGAGWRPPSGFRILCGGEPMPPDLASRLVEFSDDVWNLYGPTETTVWSTCWRVGALDRGIPIGTPIANTTVQILDARMRRCALGVAGEICIGGAGVASGYLNRPELTAERFVDDPEPAGHRSAGLGDAVPAKLYRTGDRGRWRTDGQLEHLGRLDFQIKLRGHRIELEEIGNNLLTHPSVARATVIAREDRPGDVRLVAYVVPAAGAAIVPRDLLSHLRRFLPDYMVPQHVVELAALPLLPNGKIDRHSLPAPATSGGAEAPPAAGSDPAYAYLQALWSELLETRVGPSDNFFDLGGHSMLAVQMANRVSRETGVRLKLMRLATQTLGEIAADTPELAARLSPPGMRKRFTRGLTRLFARARDPA
ncbi:amino acid adenylation domain-containing protein [Lysobacter ciconiae]|uniref:Amino acid adenylation domain-containing protein n=1 Tax=Novilysobacter ciconiae TaxID=2781022 RepID=A0A7S6UEJ4_9GAMM|nr:non-ribosomal peptide synthetase/type I polyketide synthase [Lysobacter ciconiae]QOW18806.1 amino acid adenylation domain-containing protein [Lysobacter ciconiae]